MKSPRQDLEQALEGLTDEQIGALFREYIVEGNHNSWDGWSGLGIARARGVLELIQDLTRWYVTSKVLLKERRPSCPTRSE